MCSASGCCTRLLAKAAQFGGVSVRHFQDRPTRPCLGARGLSRRRGEAAGGARLLAAQGVVTLKRVQHTLIPPAGAPGACSGHPGPKPKTAAISPERIYGARATFTHGGLCFSGFGRNRCAIRQVSLPVTQTKEQHAPAPTPLGVGITSPARLFIPIDSLARGGCGQGPATSPNKERPEGGRHRAPPAAPSHPRQRQDGKEGTLRKA